MSRGERLRKERHQHDGPIGLTFNASRQVTRDNREVGTDSNSAARPTCASRLEDLYRLVNFAAAASRPIHNIAKSPKAVATIPVSPSIPFHSMMRNWCRRQPHAAGPRRRSPPVSENCRRRKGRHSGSKGTIGTMVDRK